MIVQVGPYPEPIGGVSVYIKRMKQYMDTLNVSNEVWDISGIKKKAAGVVNIRLRYVPFKLIKDQPDLVHYHIPGTSHKLYVAAFNRMLKLPVKKVITIHGDSRELFHKGNMISGALNSFDRIICVKAGDGEYLRKKGVACAIDEIPSFIPPLITGEVHIPKYILDFINHHSFIIAANASCIQFYRQLDLYGIDMCIQLMEKLIGQEKGAGLIFFLPNVNDKDYYNNLRLMAKEMGVSEHILFVTEKMEIYPVIGLSHLFIRPTCSDGYGISVAEAICQKVPAIASDVCERPAGTIIFKSRDLDELYKKTLDIMENYSSHVEKIRNMKQPDNKKKVLDIYIECLKG